MWVCGYLTAQRLQSIFEQFLRGAVAQLMMPLTGYVLLLLAFGYSYVTEPLPAAKRVPGLWRLVACYFPKADAKPRRLARK